jgi:hypothetical protein
MNSNTAPFVLEKGFMAFMKTIVFDFYMFLQLVLFYVVCLVLGVLFLILDEIFRTKKLTNSLAAFFEYIANL